MTSRRPRNGEGEDRVPATTRSAPAGKAAGNVGVGSWIERRARIVPDGIALVGGGRALTYLDLARRIRRLANGLREAGVARGERVAWLGENHPAFIESLFATALLGGVLVPVNHRLPAT